MVNIEKRIDENDAHYELVVTGEIDASSSIHLDEALREAIENSKNILVDLNGLDYISSAGLGVFMSNIQKIEGFDDSLIITKCDSMNSGADYLMREASFDNIGHTLKVLFSVS